MSFIDRILPSWRENRDNFLGGFSLARGGTYTEQIVNPYAFGDDVLGVELPNNFPGNIMSIPPVWAAVDFLAGTLASLPLRVHERESGKIVKNPTSRLLGIEPDQGFSSFDWRYSIWKSVFTRGEGFTYIERSGNGALKRLHWMFDVDNVERKRKNNRLEYKFIENKDATVKTWPVRNVIDLAWMRSADGIDCISPYVMHHETFNLAFAFKQYQRNFASSGGVPPYVLKARWDSKNAIKDGLRDYLSAVRLANKRGDSVVPIGKNMDIEALGANPEQGRVIETQQFIVREICRIYNIPPIYLHDIDRMTFNNAEHQALNLTKYTITRWAEQLEQQLSLKCVPPQYEVRHDLDGLLRGDYMSRIQGHSTAVFSGQLTPNEARKFEDREPLDNGDELFIQSGTQPISTIKDQIEMQIKSMEANNGNGNQGGNGQSVDS